MTMEFVIEKNYRAPRGKVGRKLTFPWDIMAIDDSFFLPLPEPDPKRRGVMICSGNQWGYRHNGAHFTAEWTNGPPSGYRVWRVA